MIALGAVRQVLAVGRSLPTPFEQFSRRVTPDLEEGIGYFSSSWAVLLRS